MEKEKYFQLNVMCAKEKKFIILNIINIIMQLLRLFREWMKLVFLLKKVYQIDIKWFIFI